MNWSGSSGVTRTKVPQTSLALDSGATIHFFQQSRIYTPNQEEQSFNEDSLWWNNIRSSNDRPLTQQIELKHLPCRKERCVLLKMA